MIHYHLYNKEQNLTCQTCCSIACWINCYSTPIHNLNNFYKTLTQWEHSDNSQEH